MGSKHETENACKGDREAKIQGVFDEEFGLLRHTTKKRTRIRMKQIRVSQKHCRLRHLLGFVPLLEWLPKYNIKQNLVSDILGGLTVGIMHVPQGMAYSSLAGVQPVNGLYTSLFPAFFYMFFGTSRHVSLGVFAVVSLMAGSCNERVSSILRSLVANGTLTDNDEDARMRTSVAIVTSLTLCVGLFQIAMAVLRLDFLITFLSDQIIGGFTTGAAVHVFTAQLNKILGVPLPRRSGPGKLFLIYKDLFARTRAGYVNWMTFTISVGTILMLFLVKTYVDPLIKKKCNVPVPYDLFVIIFGTLLSTVLNLHDRFEVKIIGHVPTGMPAPSLPNLTLFGYFLGDALAISVVSLVITVSMGKLFAKKHKYEIDVRQEFYALGFVEVLCSFFPVWPSSTALARSLVYEGAGTKTQLGTVFSSLLLLSVIFLLGRFIEVLPVCFLSCIIIVALKGMFMQLGTIASLWHVSKYDCAIFVVSFAATVIFDVVEGLLIGTFFAAAVLVYGIQSTQIVEIGRLYRNGDQSYFQPVKNYRNIELHDGVCCVRFPAPLVYLNAERFKKGIADIIALPALKRRWLEGKDELEKSLQNCNESGTALRSLNVITADVLQQSSLFDNKPGPVRTIVIDLSAVPQIDITGAQCLFEVFNESRNKGITIYCAAAPLELHSRLQAMLASKDSDLLPSFFPSIEDALNNVNQQHGDAKTVDR